MAVDPQPTTSKHTEMSRFCGPDVRDPIGGSSQLRYYPYLLALSNQKSAGAGAFPPLLRRCAAAARRGQNVLIAEQQVKTKPGHVIYAIWSALLQKQKRSTSYERSRRSIPTTNCTIRPGRKPAPSSPTFQSHGPWLKSAIPEPWWLSPFPH
jgi:hypothetical protein